MIGKRKSVDNLLAAIENSKDRPLPFLIKAMGVRNLGRHAGKDLAAKYGSMQRIMQLTVLDFEDLVAIPGFGDVTASAVLELAGSLIQEKVVDRLTEAGVNMTHQTDTVSAKPLQGKTFVVTGTLPTLGRKDAEAMIEAAGGKTSSSVSKATSFVLAGENAGSKLDKAQTLGIPVISEEVFLEMLKEDK